MIKAFKNSVKNGGFVLQDQEAADLLTVDVKPMMLLAH